MLPQEQDGPAIERMKMKDAASDFGAIVQVVAHLSDVFGCGSNNEILHFNF